MLSSLFCRFILLFITLIGSQTCFILSLPSSSLLSSSSDLHHLLQQQQEHERGKVEGTFDDRVKRSSRLDDDDDDALESPDENNDESEGLTRLITSSRSVSLRRESRSTSSPLSSPSSPLSSLSSLSSSSLGSSTRTTSISSPNDNRMLVVMMINDKDNLIKATNMNNRRTSSSIDDDDGREDGGEDGREEENNRRTLPLNPRPSSSFPTSSSLSFSRTTASSFSSSSGPHHRETRSRSPLEDDDVIRPIHGVDDEFASSSLRRRPDASSSSRDHPVSPGRFFKRQRQSSLSLMPTPPPFESQGVSFSRNIHDLSNSRIRDDNVNSHPESRHPDGPDDDLERRSMINRDRLPDLVRTQSLPVAPWEKRHKNPKTPSVGNWIARLLNPLQVFGANVS